jgi:hypothetical protein
MLQNRGIKEVRALMGLLSLTNKHRRDQIEHACQIAQGHGANHLRSLRQLIEHRSFGSGTVQKNSLPPARHPHQHHRKELSPAAWRRRDENQFKSRTPEYRRR